MYTKEQVAQYLERIGVTGELPLTSATLTKIIAAHYCAVPYENQYILAGRPLDLDPQALFEKIVLRHRGGFCFELNEALGNLLSSLGFSVTHLAARFILGEPADRLPMRRHHVLLVHLPDGDWLCDAGIMREAPRVALKLTPGLVQGDGIGEYKFVTDPFYGNILMQKLPGQDFVPFFGFTMEPQINADFVMPCFYCEKHPGSPFIHGNMVGIHTPTGSWNLSGSQLRRLEGAEIVERRDLTDEEIPGVLRDIFGLA